MIINEINLYEARYILKQKTDVKDIDIDIIIDSFVENLKITVYKNTELDFIVASDIKSEGGLSPYDAFMIAQIKNNNTQTIQLVTLDSEFKQPKFTLKYDINILK